MTAVPCPALLPVAGAGLQAWQCPPGRDLALPLSCLLVPMAGWEPGKFWYLLYCTSPHGSDLGCPCWKAPQSCSHQWASVSLSPEQGEVWVAPPCPWAARCLRCLGSSSPSGDFPSEKSDQMNETISDLQPVCSFHRAPGQHRRAGAEAGNSTSRGTAPSRRKMEQPQ